MINISKDESDHFSLMLETMLRSNFKNLEFEVLFKSKHPSIKKNIERTDFENVIRRLKALGMKPISQPDVLDITFRQDCHTRPSNIRVSITGLEGIRQYCSMNRLDRLGNEVTFTYKHLAKTNDGLVIRPLYLDNYYLKFNLKYENTYVKSNFEDQTGIIERWTQFYKLFR